MTIAVGSESQGSDIVRYMNDVKLLHFSNFTLDSAIRYYKQSGEVDILRTVLSHYSITFYWKRICFTYRVWNYIRIFLLTEHVVHFGSP